MCALCVRAVCILLLFYVFHNKSSSNGESISIYMLCVSYIFIHRFIIIWQHSIPVDLLSFTVQDRFICYNDRAQFKFSNSNIIL